MNRTIASLLGLVAGGALVAALAYTGRLPGMTVSSSVNGAGTVPIGNGAASARSGSPATPQQVVALAKLQPAGGVMELGGTPGDRVEQILVKAGQAVKKGQELLKFESRKLRQLELDAAASQLAEAEARLKAEQTYADALVGESQLLLDQAKLDELELAAQTTRLKSLELQAAAAERNLQRVEKLSAEITSAQQRDQAQLARDQAANELAAAQGQLEKLKQGIALKKREAEFKSTQANAGRAKVDATIPLESLRKAKAAAEERLKLATLTAPSDGVVIEVPAVEGGTVAQMPLVRMADTSRMVAIAEVYETQVPALRENQTAELSADALPRKLSGVVERIGTTVGRNRMLSLDPTQPTDAHVVEVRIKLADDSAAIAAQYIGLQTTAVIRTAN